MARFDPEKADAWLSAVKPKLVEYYVSKGLSRQEAEEIADAYAMKLLAKTWGPGAVAKYRMWKRRAKR